MSSFSWSFSALEGYETCPSQYYHYYISKDVQRSYESRGAGIDAHACLEARIKDDTPLPLELARHEPLLKTIIDAPGQVYAEQKLALTSSFTPTGWFSKDTWLRVIIDATKVNGEVAAAIDWKTGKPKHDVTQLELIAAALFYHLPNLARVKSALVFLSHDIAVSRTFERSDLTGIWARLLPRVKKLEHARRTKEFPPTPNGLCRKWCAVTSCPFHGRGG